METEKVIKWFLAPNPRLDKKLKDLDFDRELELAEERNTVFTVICPACECEELYLDLNNVHKCLQCDNKYHLKNYRVGHSDEWAEERYGITRSIMKENRGI